MRFRIAVVALLLAGLTSARPAAQAGLTPEQQSYISAATAILVDVVVRDRRGRPVTDLTAADFEIAEDGVAQQVDTFTRVTRGGGIGVGVAWRSSATTVSVASSEPSSTDTVETVEREPAVTALVFDHLSPEALRLAQRATLQYVPVHGESDVKVGVFATGPGVRVLQGYTNDRLRVRQAVQRIVPAGTSADEQTADRTTELMARRRDLRESESQAAGAGTTRGADLAGDAGEVGLREVEMRMVQTELNMIRSFQHLDREHRGYDTSDALISVIRTLAEFPGRKTIVFFSEGLPVSPVLSAKLDHVIDAANRSNVTAYAVDAHGLRAASTLTAARKEIDAFAEERMFQNATGVARTEQPLTMAFERVEDTFRLDSRTGLARLARDTGGFLVEGSNDLSSAFRRIDEDHQFHYLLTYSPRNAVFDGKFRAIQVKVRRPGTQVFARKGYRAVRTPGLDSDSYETPALALLDRSPLPRAFPTHGAAFTFPDPERPGLTPILVQVNTSALSFTLDRQRSTYSGQAAVVVRVRDGEGDVVQKLSQEYLFAGDAKDVEAAKTGQILFYREVDLEPGVYTVESIVFDPVAGQGSARVGTVTVPAVERSRFGMSSLLLVNRAEEVGEMASTDPAAAGPLYVGRTLLYPNLGEPIRKASTGELPFYFTLYGEQGDATARAELLRNGQAIGEAPVQLPPSRDGRTQHVGRLPVGALPAGTYELRIRVIVAGRELARSAFFTLQD
jgi:VWFA-related protein